MRDVLDIGVMTVYISGGLTKIVMYGYKKRTNNRN